jgi:hypothetical protein
MSRTLHTLTTEQRAALQPSTSVIIDGRSHQLGTVISYRDAESGELTEVHAFSFAADTWLNLLTGRPIGDPRDADDLDTMARYYDARGLAADLDAARRLAETRRRRDPANYKVAVDELRHRADLSS